MPRAMSHTPKDKEREECLINGNQSILFYQFYFFFVFFEKAAKERKFL